MAELHLGVDGLRRAMEASAELTTHVINHGFADMYSSETLDQRARKISTLASLVTSASQPQLEWHIRGAISHGFLKKVEIEQLIAQMTIYIGYTAAYNGMAVAKRVFAEFPEE